MEKGLLLKKSIFIQEHKQNIREHYDIDETVS